MKKLIFGVLLCLYSNINLAQTSDIHEQQCLKERQMQQLVLMQLAKSTYTDIVNTWREMYYAQEMSFETYQSLIKYANIFVKMPTYYQSEENREKLVNDLFDICVMYPKSKGQ